MPIPQAQVDNVTGNDLPLLHAIYGSEQALKLNLKRSAFGSLEDASYLFNPDTGILQDAKEALEEIRDLSLRNKILHTILNQTNPATFTATLTHIKNNNAPDLDIDSLKTLHEVLHDIPTIDHRPGHGDRQVGTLALHLELSPGNPYSHSLIAEEDNPVTVDYKNSVQNYLKACWHHYHLQDCYSLSLHALANMSKRYIARKTARHAKPHLIDELNHLSTTILKISACKKLNLRQRLGAMAYRLRLHLQAKQSSIRLFSLRDALHAKLPVSYQIVTDCLKLLRQFTQPAMSENEEHTAFKTYALLDGSFTNESEDDRIEANPVLKHGHRLSINVISRTKKQAEKTKARLLLSYWLDHNAPAHLTQKHIRENIKVLLNEAEASAHPSTNATTRARWLFSATEPVEYSRYINLLDEDDALIRLEADSMLTHAAFGDRFIMNAHNGRIYLKATYDSIASHTAADEQARDPMTREPFITKNILPTDIDWRELNRLINLQRMQHPAFYEGLERGCATKAALYNLSCLHPALLQAATIPLLNAIQPALSSSELITQINRLIAQHGIDSTTALLDQCVAHKIPLPRLRLLPANVLNHEAAWVLSQMTAVLTRPCFNAIEQAASLHDSTSALALLRHCLTHGIELNHLSLLTENVLNELLRVDCPRHTLLPQRIELMHQRSMATAGRLRKSLNGTLSGFWRRNHKTGRLEHFEDIGHRLNVFMPAPANVGAMALGR